MSAKQFREYADECMSWAKTAASDKDRQNYAGIVKLRKMTGIAASPRSR